MFLLINKKISANIVPWESARYQPILTLSFFSSSTCNIIISSISTYNITTTIIGTSLTSLITSLTTSPSLPSSITTLSYIGTKYMIIFTFQTVS